MESLYGPGSEEPEVLRPVRDLTGLPVDDAEGRPTGEVYGSLAEARSGLVRYLDVSMRDSDRHVLVPIGHARVDRADGKARVRLRAAVREDLHDIPSYEADPEQVDSEYQERLLAAHGRVFYGERYYAHPAFDHSGLYAGEHPIVRKPPGAEAPGPHPLAPLGELPGFEVSQDEPDIRGWPLADGTGTTVGTVRELFVDPEAHKVRYAVVDTDEGRSVLLPVGFLQVDRPALTVHTPALTVDDLRTLPEFSPPLTRGHEDAVRHTLEARLGGPRRFQRPDFAEP